MKALLAPLFAVLIVLVAVLAALALDAGDYRPPHLEPPAAAATWPLEATGISPDQLIAQITFTEGIRRAEEEAARLERNASTPVVMVAGAGTGETPAPNVVATGCDLDTQIRAAWAGTGDEDWAVRVAVRESHCTPGARNASGASGVFQLMMPLHRQLIADVCGEPADDLVFDAACNIAAARALYAGAGRGPWGG